MTSSSHIKKQLLRQAVQENTGQRLRLSTQSTHYSPPVPLSKRFRRFLAKSILFALIVGPLVSLAALSLLVFYPTYDTPFNNFKLLTSQLFNLALAMQRSVPLEAHVSEETFPIPKPFDFRVFPLRVKKIIIDPGHGGNDGGAVGSQGTLEKEVTLDIALRLRKLMQAKSFQVVMTRETDTAVPIDKRVTLANAEHADLFVSIHANWFKDASTRGIETFYLGPTDDPHSLQVAALENKASGYSLGQFRRLLENVYLNVRRDESHHLATSIQGQLSTSLRPLNSELIDRGVKMAPFLVLVSTKMPAVLTEVSFLSNQNEAKLLATPQYRQGIAQAIFQGVLKYTQTFQTVTKKGT
jgi:N-acetylmuramoyl-L-alanine amidase